MRDVLIRELIDAGIWRVEGWEWRVLDYLDALSLARIRRIGGPFGVTTRGQDTHTDIIIYQQQQ